MNIYKLIFENIEEKPYFYHMTNEDGFFGIVDDGYLDIFEPSHGTPEQDMWPDGGTEDRAYFSLNPKATESFAPMGRSVLLRVQKSFADFKRERGTGDWYVTERIVASKIEHEENGKWENVI